MKIEIGKIVITDEVYFEPKGLEKPNVKIHSRGGLFNATKEYEASKRLIEVSNVNHVRENEYSWIIIKQEFLQECKYRIENNTQCKAEVNGKAEIIELL